jgi:catechol 2,3-dioxygenase-like lactoylglutathione lyase family enzyme
MRSLLLWSILGSLSSVQGDLLAAEPVSLTAARPWKIDVDILHGAEYEGRYGSFSKGHLHVDKDDRLWLPLVVYFPDDQPNTDAYHPLEKQIMLVSEDKGLTWEITERPSPAPSHNRVTTPDGAIIELGGSGYLRYPRTEVKRLEKEGYHAWDLGPQDDYCAIIYDLWRKRSTDGGKTWQKQEIHKQLPFFAHFVARGPLRLLDDGSLIYFAYGCTPEERVLAQDDPTTTVEGRLHSYGHGRWSVYCVRSDDGGETWKAVRAAAGKLSPIAHGFSETFPIITADGNLFVVLRTGLGTHAYSVASSDGGRTWTKAVQTPIQAKHPLPTLLRDGTIVCSYQRRFAIPFGVRARFTSDRGKTWSEEIVLRDDVPISDGLAEPTTVELSDGTLFTAFQGYKFDNRGRKWPFIGGCRWSRNYRTPYAPKLTVPKRTKKINSKPRDK